MREGFLLVYGPLRQHADDGTSRLLATKKKGHRMAPLFCIGLSADVKSIGPHTAPNTLQ